MEATAGILRSHIESWRSSPVRWVLERVGAQVARFTGHASTPFAAQDRWQEIFWDESNRRADARTRSGWMEQAELWSEPSPTRTEFVAVTAPEPAPAVAAAEVIRTERRVRTPAKPRSLRARPSKAYAQQRRSVRTVDVARYLQVNQAVHGADGAPDPFDLPRRSFAARVLLWKGRKVGTPFLCGC